MIQDPSKDLTLIVYNSPSAPRYLKLNKQLLKGLSIVIPLLTIIFLGVAFIYSMYLKNQIIALKSSEPKIIANLKSQVSELNGTIESLQKQTLSLTQKISKGTSSTDSNGVLNLFTIPIGIEDLRANELLKIENMKIAHTENQITLNFDLANNSTDKLSGYLFVTQFQENIVQFYPNSELNEKNLKLEYSQGEYFSFSRFRPTIATFSKVSKRSARYKIYIFSRTGNLLAYKQVGPYNID